MKRKNGLLLLFCLFMLISYSGFTNNITVTNLSLTGQNVTEHFAMVKFDISWENSWRTSSSPNNWDAAWVFVKYRIGTGAWMHAWLDDTGHINLNGSTIATGLLDQALPFNPTTNPGLGVFIYRDADGTGTFSATGVQLRWNYGSNGVADNAEIDIQVHAIEQVYVPQGSFYAGSGGTEFGAFYTYPTSANPYQITGEGPITIGAATGNLYYNQDNIYCGDQLGPIPSVFPKGFNAFYCMKYELSQQGYADFLNSLTTAQAANRYSTLHTSWRYNITDSSGVYTCTSPYASSPFVACNFISWGDLTAYLDWSGLRPMTELEFEKACRGTQTNVPNEFAWGIGWGTTGATANSAYTLSSPGLANENIATNYSTTGGNAAWDTTIQKTLGDLYGQVRVGIFAGNELNTGRVSAGATYYGIMEMSGNLYECPVTVGNPAGRGFNGSNGNGLLDDSGNADVPTWPGFDGMGSGNRGGGWGDNFTLLAVSGRYAATWGDSLRWSDIGCRGVRVAP